MPRIERAGYTDTGAAILYLSDRSFLYVTNPPEKNFESCIGTELHIMKTVIVIAGRPWADREGGSTIKLRRPLG